MGNNIQIKADPAEIKILIRNAKKDISVFNDPNELIHHLKIFRTNPSYEWFNILLIASDPRLKESGFTMVRPEDSWGPDVKPFGLKGTGIQIIWPEYSFESHEFFWSVKSVYSIMDFGMGEPALEKDVETPITVAIRTYDLEEIIKYQKNEWQDILINSYLSERNDYKQLDDALQHFIKSSLILSWGSTRQMENRLKKTDIVLDPGPEDKLTAYKHLYSIVTGFIPFFISWMMSHASDREDVRSLTLQRLYGETT